MNWQIAPKLKSLPPVWWLSAACLVLAACGGGNNAGTATTAPESQDTMKTAFRVEGEPFDPVPCAVQGGTCAVAGEQNVAYGTNGKYIVKRFRSHAPCDDNAFYGEHIGGRVKRCFVAVAVTSATLNPVGAVGDDMASVAAAPPSAAPAAVATPPAAPRLTPAPASPAFSPAPVVVSAALSVATLPAPAPALSQAATSPAASTPVLVAAAPSVTAPAPTPPTSAPMRHGGINVDTANLPVPQPGVSTVMLTAPGVVPSAPAAGDWEHDGAFRLLCNWSKMSYDDPIVYPGQPGVAHHHTFFGNTAIDAFTTSENIRSKGNATCRGGTVNLSGYWVPSMIDTSSGQPIAPKSLLIYYKTGHWQYMNDNSVIQPLPKGLKMIAGDASRSTPGGGGFLCFDQATQATRPGTGGNSIPTCPAGDELRSTLGFPQCWDGINLDSPDHKSHMAEPEQFWTGNPERQYRCPLTHPVVLPRISFTVMYAVPPTANTGKWRLASDTYDSTKPGGYSIHGDWMNGWDPVITELWGIKCMRERRDCGSANMGDGRNTMEFQGN